MVVAVQPRSVPEVVTSQARCSARGFGQRLQVARTEIRHDTAGRTVVRTANMEDARVEASHRFRLLHAGRRLKENAIDRRENRDVCAYAEAERKDDSQREAW